MSLRPAAEVAREWLEPGLAMSGLTPTAEGIAGLAALVERVRAEALREAAEVVRRFDPALDPGILPLRILALGDPCGSCGHPLAGHVLGYGCGAGGGVCKCPVGQ